MPEPYVTTSCGLFADSRLARLVAVEDVEVREKLTGAVPETSEVTSHTTHVLELIGPEESVTARAPGMFR
jgi:hypothetical protein